MSQPMPTIRGAFHGFECDVLFAQYRRDPSDLTCPRCNLPGTMAVLAFVLPEPVDEDLYTETVPSGRYAVAVRCDTCAHAILLNMEGN